MRCSEPGGMALLPFYRRTLNAQKPLQRRVLRLTKPYPTTPATVGEQLRKWRIDSCLTLREAGKRLGVDLSTYNHWESGKFSPGRSRWSKIATVLNHNPFVGG
jgi:DNA-binding XRE family transcriptional regulator